uniref:Uncharacterized protein n=1 Tax=Siphoviridae sp. ctk5O4 TaxID=2827921 RepID=A0A8S5SL06_9CAUD|nr:MAG TPA: hypothetical protein [Siphoviridae sp. ctk5O4]
MPSPFVLVWERLKNIAIVPNCQQNVSKKFIKIICYIDCFRLGTVL